MREIFSCGIQNPGIWNLAYSSRNPESKFYWQRRNPVPGIQNPWQGIQNPRLCWIPLHGAILNTVNQKFLSPFSLVTLAIKTCWNNESMKMIMILELQNEIKCTEDGYCSYRHNFCIFSKKRARKDSGLCTQDSNSAKVASITAMIYLY